MTQTTPAILPAEAPNFWKNFLLVLSRAVPRVRFETWLSRLSLGSRTEDSLELVAPNSFTRDWIQRHYLLLLQQAAKQVDGRIRSVRILQQEDLAGEPAVPLGPPPPGAEEAPGPGAGGEGALSAPAGREGEAPSFEAPGEVPPPSGEKAAAPFWEESDPPPAEGEGASGGNGRSLGGFPLPLLRLEEKAAPPPADSLTGEPAVSRAGREKGGFNPQSLSFFQDNSDFVLNKHYTFESFVIGASNELSCAAAKAVVDFPGGPYNPLFLHGPSGLGKTHLLQAICHAVLRGEMPRKVLYLSCENFVNQFIQAVTNGDLESFRYKYRKVDMLLVDDIQFLEGKTRTQEEFFHTFNTLYNGSRQIVLTSDRPPKEITTLQDRLVSRMRWGMVTRIEAPCLETRVAIVKRKARQRGFELSPEVSEFIGEAVDTNIRELEGAVTKVVGFANLMARPIQLSLVKEALKDLIPHRGQVGVQNILDLVARDFGVPARELQSKRRVKSVVLPRQVAIYLARKLTALSLEEIGGFFGGRDHSTVLHSFKKVEMLRRENGEFAEKVDHLLGQLSRSG